jgi:NTE family protein
MRTVSHPVSTQPAASHRPSLAPRTAFVLAGAASPGAMQVGMLRALYECGGVAPALLVGTSAGALNAAYIASRPQTVATAEALARVWRGLHRVDISPINPRAVISGLTNHRDHLVPDSGLCRLVVRSLQIERLEHASVPLHLVAFDLLSGREVRLSDGPAMDAMLAAAAIPGVLPPVRQGDRLLVDGGVVNNTPISHAVDLGAERIYVLATEDPAARAAPLIFRGALDAAVHALMLAGPRLQSDLVRYAGAAELVVLPAVNRERIQPTDFDHASRLIAHALAAARTALAPPGRRARRRVSPMIRVAFLDDHPAVRAGLHAILATEPDLLVAAAVAGADAIVGKSSATATLVEAIPAVARNPRTIPQISPQMKADAAARLDPADHAILVAGDSPVEIAATLGVPDATIADRIAAIVAKLEPLRSAA